MIESFWQYRIGHRTFCGKSKGLLMKSLFRHEDEREKETLPVTKT